jgi:predicted RNA-binding Zn-ribbon protein involved in translation (DUF1610 family)
MFNAVRGWFGEKKTAVNMWVSLNTHTYQRFHDVYIPTFNGTAQIDHLLISPFGVFIVETKNFKGWVFGDEKAAQWTQSLYGKKYRFQNPLRQTYRQKKALAAYFDIDEQLIKTVVYFTGDCELKTELPVNVLDRGLGRYIKRFKNVVLSDSEMDGLLRKVHQHTDSCTTTSRQHVKALRSRHNSTNACPKCGSELVERVARSGANAGNKFLGCNSFPKCRFIKS